MTVYLVIYFILFLFALLERLDDKKEITGILTKKTAYLFVSVVLIIFAGLRYYTGPDYESYKNIFYSYPDTLSFASRFEPGFMLCVHIIKNILKLGYMEFLLVFTAVNIFIKTTFFSKYFKYPVLLLMLYYPFIYFFSDFGQIRQGMALSFMLWCLPAMQKNKPIQFYINFLLACSFHYSMIIFFPFYFLRKLRLDIKSFLVFFILFFLTNLLHISTLLFKLGANIFSGTFLGIIMEYILSGYGSTLSFGELLRLYFAPSSILNLMLVFLFLYLYREEKKEKTDIIELTIYNVDLMIFLLVKFFISIEAIEARGSYFYKFYEIFLFYAIGEKIKEKEAKLIYWVVLFFYGILRFALIYFKFPEIYENYRMNVQVLGL